MGVLTRSGDLGSIIGIRITPIYWRDEIPWRGTRMGLRKWIRNVFERGKDPIEYEYTCQNCGHVFLRDRPPQSTTCGACDSTDVDVTDRLYSGEHMLAES